MQSVVGAQRVLICCHAFVIQPIAPVVCLQAKPTPTSVCDVDVATFRFLLVRSPHTVAVRRDWITRGVKFPAAIARDTSRQRTVLHHDSNHCSPTSTCATVLFVALFFLLVAGSFSALGAAALLRIVWESIVNQ